MTTRRTSRPGQLSRISRNPSAIPRRDVEAAGLAKDVGELAARLAHGGRVDEREQLFDVIDQRPVEESLVPYLKRGEEDVALDVRVLATQVLEDALDL